MLKNLKKWLIDAFDPPLPPINTKWGPLKLHFSDEAIALIDGDPQPPSIYGIEVKCADQLKFVIHATPEQTLIYLYAKGEKEYQAAA